jgi:hypothetical protein
VELHLVDAAHGVCVGLLDALYLLPTITTLSLQHECEQLLQLLTLPHLEHLVLAKVWLPVHAQNLYEFLNHSCCKLMLNRQAQRSGVNSKNCWSV